MATHSYINIDGVQHVYSIYNSGDDILPVSGIVGLDTETERIKDHRAPPLVLIGVCCGTNIQLVPWQLADEYMERLLAIPGYVLALFNGGFDMRVLGREKFTALLDANRVIELSVNYRMKHLAEDGWFNPGATLASTSKELLGWAPPKDSDVRLGFLRDIIPSREQLEYLCHDAAATYQQGVLVQGMPTEGLQARASLVLSDISERGMLVSRRNLQESIEKVKEEMDVEREKLEAMGVYVDSVYGYTAKELIDTLLEKTGVTPPMEVREKALKADWHEVAIGVMSAMPDGFAAVVRIFYSWAAKNTLMISPEANDNFHQKLASLGCDSVLESKKSDPFKVLIWACFRQITKNRLVPDVEAAWGEFKTEYEKHMGWMTKTTAVSASAMIQTHLQELCNGNIELNGLVRRTEKTKQIAVSKKDSWMLEDCGVNSPLLTSWFTYKHCEKLLSTYLTDKYIGTDGRVHPRFTVMVRTGRTACSKPNLQNPAADIGVREQYAAPPGMLMCSVDYNQLELCTLSETNIVRQGNCRMGELINAGIHLHRWFHGYRIGDIKAEDYDGTQASVDRINRIIKKYEKKELKLDKACNFGTRISHKRKIIFEIDRLRCMLVA